MVPNPITVTIQTTVEQAIELMKINSIRHLPVADAHKQLQGLLTLADLKQALIPSMLGDLTLADMMIKKPLTVGPDDDIEIAAQLIYKHKISGLPVTRKGKLVGILTESDILRAFIDMMGILNASSRIDVEVEDKPGSFKKASHIIQDKGGDIINVGMTVRQKGKRTYFFRLFSCKTDIIKKALEAEGVKVYFRF